MITILLMAVIFSLLLNVNDNAFGYIDPGTGSVIFSAVGYVIATAAAFFAIFLRPLKSLIKKLFKRGGDPASVPSENDNK